MSKSYQFQIPRHITMIRAILWYPTHKTSFHVKRCPIDYWSKFKDNGSTWCLSSLQTMLHTQAFACKIEFLPHPNEHYSLPLKRLSQCHSPPVSSIYFLPAKLNQSSSNYFREVKIYFERQKLQFWKSMPQQSSNWRIQPISAPLVPKEYLEDILCLPICYSFTCLKKFSP